MKYLNTDIQKNISLYLRTRDSALDVLDKLEHIVDDLGTEGISNAEFYEKFTQKLDLREKEIITFLINDVLDGRYDKGSLSNVAQEFSDFVKDVELVHVSISFIPSTKFINELFDWFHKNFAPNDIFLLKVETSEDIFAGLNLSYKGNYYDLTLDSKIEAFLNGYQFTGSE